MVAAAVAVAVMAAAEAVAVAAAVADTTATVVAMVVVAVDTTGINPTQSKKLLKSGFMPDFFYALITHK